MEKILFNNSNSSSSKVKDSWERENNLKFDKDYPYGYPWPPRYYTCNFCHREFRSAQALGGHMNIHRRDRARLRDLSPTIDSDQNPNSSNNSNPNNPNPNNPNPNNPSISNNNNFSSPSSSSPTIINNNNTTTTHQSYSLVSLSLSSIPPTNHGKEPSHYKIENPVFVSSIVDDYNQNNNNNNHQIRVLKNSTNNSTKEVVRLDLELCVGEEAKEDLDLELRLGVK